MPKNMTAMKAYDIIRDLENDSAEINLYGEVVESVPVDWWTGEPVEGLFISLKDFLDDVTELKDVKNITVRINSVGGDLSAGLAIYNRLKTFDNVTTIVDGLAASAASIIAQAGKKRCVYNSSQLMIHGASTMLYGYYNQNELEQVRKTLQGADKSVVNVYKETTGESEVKLRHMVEETTWMVGDEIITAGFADELIEGSVILNSAANSRFINCNGISFIKGRMPMLPKNVQVIEEAHEPAIINSKKEEIKMTLEELMKQEPELVKQIQDSAKKEAVSDIQPDTKAMENAVKNAVTTERQRIADIESIEASIADKELVNAAKFGENPMDARELAFQAMQKQASLGNQFMNSISAENNASGTAGVAALPAEPAIPSAVDEGKAVDESIKNVVDALKKAKGVK